MLKRDFGLAESERIDIWIVRQSILTVQNGPQLERLRESGTFYHRRIQLPLQSFTGARKKAEDRNRPLSPPDP
eukprot:1195984-Prorocentrum_minimum.AAC.10